MKAGVLVEAALLAVLGWLLLALLALAIWR